MAISYSLFFLFFFFVVVVVLRGTKGRPQCMRFAVVFRGNCPRYIYIYIICIPGTGIRRCPLVKTISSSTTLLYVSYMLFCLRLALMRKALFCFRCTRGTWFIRSIAVDIQLVGSSLLTLGLVAHVWHTCIYARHLTRDECNKVSVICFIENPGVVSDCLKHLKSL